MNAIEKSEILAQLGLPRSTYYRWLERQMEHRLQDRKSGSPTPWNKALVK